MPMFKVGAGTQTNVQLFPGETFISIMPSAATTIFTWNVPEDYYANPERYSYPEEPTPWGYTEERRASPALYDYRSTDDAGSLAS